MILDFDGHILAQGDPGPHEKIVVAAEIDPDAFGTRATRQGHQMLAHCERSTRCIADGPTQRQFRRFNVALTCARVTRRLT